MKTWSRNSCEDEVNRVMISKQYQSFTSQRKHALHANTRLSWESMTIMLTVNELLNNNHRRMRYSELCKCIKLMLEDQYKRMRAPFHKRHHYETSSYGYYRTLFCALFFLSHISTRMGQTDLSRIVHYFIAITVFLKHARWSANFIYIRQQ